MSEWGSWTTIWQTIATISINACIQYVVTRHIIKRLEKHEEKFKFWKKVKLMETNHNNKAFKTSHRGGSRSSGKQLGRKRNKKVLV